MARLDDYNKNELDKMAEQDNGYQMIDQAEKKAKRGLKNALMEATGINHLKRLVKQGLKAGAKAAFKALGKGLLAILKFLVSNPVGWVILAVLLALLLLHSCSDKDADTSAWFSTESDDEVALLLSDCPSVNKDVGATGATEGAMEENAKKIYSVFKIYGLTDEQIAGMLGNIAIESHVDSTAIETISDNAEAYTVSGPKKSAALQDLSAFTLGTVFPAYARANKSITQSAYQKDGVYCCGLGLVQWTGPAGITLQEVANGVGQNWYDFDFQMAYMLSDAKYRPNFFSKWKSGTCSVAACATGNFETTHQCTTNVKDAAYHFAAGYEGNTKYGFDGEHNRFTEAQDWYDKITTWSVDETYVNSILALADSIGLAIENTGSAQAAKKCGVKNNSVDNSSAARAAVSYAYAKKADGINNDGTELYKAVHDGVFPGDRTYRSCDRSVACAIVWSGTDIGYPNGNTNKQHEYLKGLCLGDDPKWQKLGTSQTVKYEDLQPGDVFVRDGHTVIFVGKETIQSIHGAAADVDSDTVSGSIAGRSYPGGRSPGCGNDVTIYLTSGGEVYDVYRCIKPDNSDKYKDVGAGVATK